MHVRLVNRETRVTINDNDGSSFFFGKKNCLGVVVLCCIVLLCLLSPEFIMYLI